MLKGIWIIDILENYNLSSSIYQGYGIFAFRKSGAAKNLGEGA